MPLAFEPWSSVGMCILCTQGLEMPFLHPLYGRPQAHKLRNAGNDVRGGQKYVSGYCCTIIIVIHSMYNSFCHRTLTESNVVSRGWKRGSESVNECEWRFIPGKLASTVELRHRFCIHPKYRRQVSVFRIWNVCRSLGIIIVRSTHTRHPSNAENLFSDATRGFL